MNSPRKLVCTFTIDVMSRSGVLGYQSGSGLLFGAAFTAPAGGTFSLLLNGVRARRASGLMVHFATTIPGNATLLITNPPPEWLASTGLLAIRT